MRMIYPINLVELLVSKFFVFGVDDALIGAGVVAAGSLAGKAVDNWYNSPKHQRKIIQKAGYNPNMILPSGYQSSGGFDNAVSAFTGQYGSSPERSNAASQRANVHSQVGLRQVQSAQAVQAVKNSQADIQVKRAQVRNLNAQAQGARINNALKSEEVKFKKLPTSIDSPRSIGRLIDYGYNKVKGLFSHHSSSGVVPGYNNIDRSKVRTNYKKR